MDLATVIGLVAGMICIVVPIIMGGDVTGFIDVKSIFIVLGGTIAGTLINYSLNQVIGVFKIVRNVFFQKPLDYSQMIVSLVGFADKARREGLLALEEDVDGVDDDFLKKGIQLVVDGTDPELVRNILETELSFIQDRHKAGAGILETMGALAPAFGMIGTLIGLVAMLASLDDPTTIGPSMAVALLTTLYGAVIANLLCIPTAGKLKVRSAEEMLLKEIMIEGILSIQSGDNPRIVEEKLKAFLDPQSREKVENIKSGNAAVSANG